MPSYYEYGGVGGGAAGAGAAGGGGCFFEVDPESVQMEERLVYKGEGQGSYANVSNMEMVGQGKGDFEKEKYVVASGSRPAGGLLVGVGCLSVLVAILVLGFTNNWWQAVPQADDVDACSMMVSAATVYQKETCCQKGYRDFCEQKEEAIHKVDKYYYHVKNVKVDRMVPVPIPPPPQKVITHKVMVHTDAYDCTEGSGSFASSWSDEQQRYCCYKHQIGCHTKVIYRPHYHTITKTKHVTVPMPVPVPAPPAQVITHVQNVPIHDAPQVIKVPTPGPPHVVPKYVHQKHYTPVPEPSPPQYHSVPVPVPVTDPGQVIKVPTPLPPQTVVKNKVIYKTKHVKVEHTYDCHAGYSNWQSGWSSGKKQWCCSQMSMGCPGDHSGHLTKTVVTGVTTHEGPTFYHHGYTADHSHSYGADHSYSSDSSYGSGIAGSHVVVHHHHHVVGAGSGLGADSISGMDSSFGAAGSFHTGHAGWEHRGLQDSEASARRLQDVDLSGEVVPDEPVEGEVGGEGVPEESVEGEAGGEGVPEESVEGEDGGEGVPEESVEGEVAGEGVPEESVEGEVGGEGVPEEPVEGEAGGEGVPEESVEGEADGEGVPEEAVEGEVGGEGVPEEPVEGEAGGEGVPEESVEGEAGGEGVPEEPVEGEGMVEGEGLVGGEGVAGGEGIVGGAGIGSGMNGAVGIIHGGATHGVLSGISGVSHVVVHHPVTTVTHVTNYKVPAPVPAPTPVKTLVRNHYGTVYRKVPVNHYVHVKMPEKPPIVHTVKVVAPAKTYNCDAVGGAADLSWSLEHKRWCCYRYGSFCEKKVIDKNIYHTVVKTQQVRVPVPEPMPTHPPIVKTIRHTYHVPSPPQYVHVPEPGPTVVKPVVVPETVPVPVPQPPKVINVKKPYTVHVPGPNHYVHVPVPTPPHIVTKYHTKWNTVVDHGVAAELYDCDVGEADWHSLWSHAKQRWCCQKKSVGCMGGASVTHVIHHYGDYGAASDFGSDTAPPLYGSHSSSFGMGSAVSGDYGSEFSGATPYDLAK